MEIGNRLFHAGCNGLAKKATTHSPTGMDSMKRRDFLKVTGIGAAGAATLAAPAIAQSMPELKWRMTASWPKSLDTLWGTCELFAKFVAEDTDNKFQVQTFAAGEIVPALQTLDAVQNVFFELGDNHQDLHSFPTRRPR